jgi:hypothetical protein
MRLLENAEWVQSNFGDCELGHVQRNERLQIMASNMLESPGASLPQQNPEWSDLKSAYRLCDREEVTFSAVASCHWAKTKQTPCGRYLLISDTTDIDHFHHKATTGLGMLGDGHGVGMQLHSCLVVDSAGGTVEGQAGGLIYYRKRRPKNETRAQRLCRPRESELWGTLVDQVGPPPESCQWIHVFDRGGDNFEAMCHIVENRSDWLIRASKLNRKVLDQTGTKRTLSEAVQTAKELGRYELSLRSRPGQAARTAMIRVSTMRVTILRPVVYSKYVKACGLKFLQTNVVIAQEVDAPKGVTPICWVLLTSLPAETFDQAWQILSDYEKRWLIEEYHKVLKTGCSIERHALRTAARLEALIGLISVVGVRLMQLKTYAKLNPEAKVRNHIPAAWLDALKKLRKRIYLTDLTINQFFRELAKLGGFLGRKSDGEPGWQTIWRGFNKIQNLLQAIKILRT